jgi:predicted phosphoribosyltransferase
MPFHDRAQAAHLLAKRLAGYRGQRPLVLGIPRGAVPMAKIIAEALDGELFEDFSQLSDAEVVTILRQSGPKPAPQA